ncbi:MAG: Sua5/YciO/YrdC/YwlC family protein [Woeseia sp.]
MPLRRAARLLHAGGVIAYPTEGVFGLGCLPDDPQAVLRLLDIKKRDPSFGLILIAANAAQLDGWIRLPDGEHSLASSAKHPVTWIVPAADGVPEWVRGAHAGIAVRITAHPVAAALCEAAGMPLVSTSANLSGHPPARNAWVVRRQFQNLVDFIVPGRCGPARGPSELRDLESGAVLRAATP